MRETDLRQLDLNLLVILRALLKTRSVSQAAERLGMSQPAVSRALSRLRHQFDDQLLIKSGHLMTLTTAAEALVETLDGLLKSIEAFMADREAFVPAGSERVFRVATTDYGAIAVLPQILPRLLGQAPNAGLEVLPFGRDVFRMAGDGEVDVVLYSDDPVPTSLHSLDLFVEDYCCLLRAGHPAIARAGSGRLCMPDYLAQDHVLATVFGGRRGVVDDVLRNLGLARRVAIWLPYFATAILLLVKSDLVLTLPRRAAESAGVPLGLMKLEAPVELDPFAYRMLWHERTHRDPACVWFRNLVVETMRSPDTA